jgi:Predicted pPIWI-associating nuclease
MSKNTQRIRRAKKLRFSMPVVHVRSYQYGTLKLRTLSVKDVVFIENQLELDIPAREFVANLVHNQLSSPQISLEIIHEWKNRLLLRVATAWVKHRNVLDKHLSTEIEPFEAIKQTVISYINEQNQRFAETLRGIAPLNMLSSSIMNMGLLDEQLSAQFLDISRQSQKAIEGLLRSVDGFEGVNGHLSSISSGWMAEFTKTQSVLNSMSPLLETVHSQLAEVGHIAHIAQSSLNLIDWSSISDKMLLSVELDAGIKSVYLDFSQSHTCFLDSLHESASAILALPPAFTRLPTVEFFTGVNLLETVALEEHQAVEANEKQALRIEIATETEDDFREQLMFLDPNLIRLWEGAGHALYSNNPDRARHVATSLRELLTHVLHKLSPDNEIRQWNQSPELYDKNKPTRKARLLFICRSINHGPFTDFITKDIEAVLAFVQLFQRGTHEIIIPYTEEQLVALKIRMEGIVRFLITTYRCSK